LNHNLWISAFQVDRITGMSHWCPTKFLTFSWRKGGRWNFFICFSNCLSWIISCIISWWIWIFSGKDRSLNYCKIILQGIKEINDRVDSISKSAFWS
jgi:hypothetical protein